MARMARSLTLLACVLAAAAPATAQGPAGQFLPSLDDRDGDGLLDALDCAPDDPSRPARDGADPACDGTGAGIPVEVAGPVDEGAAESAVHAAARRAAGGKVVAVRGLRLGPDVAVYAPADRRGIVVAARRNAGVTIRPARHDARTRSLAAGTAFAVRTRAPRYTITVVAGSGATWRAVYRP